MLQELIRGAVRGDRDAQHILLERYWPVIRLAVQGRKSRMGSAVAARDDTQDMAQDAALRILNDLREHEWRGSNAFAAWIRRLANTEVIDRYRYHRAQKRDAARDQRHEQSPLVAPEDHSPESRMDDHRKIEQLMLRMEKLKPEYGAALLMHHMGFSHQEVADALDCSPEAARKLVVRARVKLADDAS